MDGSLGGPGCQLEGLEGSIGGSFPVSNRSQRAGSIPQKLPSSAHFRPGGGNNQ